ncbi:MAG: hypothetical protein K1X94_11165 [Sandaracinaceae bacterium]|nr:hypothetical protein [Sandaracinaceae bacterium]
MPELSSREVLLPVTTFRRVFDTMPVQEVLTLPELVAALRRFELKPEVLARSQREIARVRRATTRVKAGLHTSAGLEVRLQKAAEEARAARRDPVAAIEAMGLRLEDEARKKAKGELRVWSPTLYVPGADKRGGEHVTHLSCLVLDHDDGTRIDDASARWSRYFHVVHSTWSHTEEHPRFRLVLPFAHLVAARDWTRVWQWAAAQSGHAIDGALKNPSSHYALPAVPNLNWPRVAFSRPGALLSPFDEGLVDAIPELALRPQGPTDGQPSVMRGLDPTRPYLDHVEQDTVYLSDDPWDDDDALEEAGPRVIAVARTLAARATHTEERQEEDPEEAAEGADEEPTDVASAHSAGSESPSSNEPDEPSILADEPLSIGSAPTAQRGEDPHEGPSGSARAAEARTAGSEPRSATLREAAILARLAALEARVAQLEARLAHHEAARAT